MKKQERGNHFLGGFANENIIKEYYAEKGAGLKPGTLLSENEDRYKLEIGIPFLNKKDIKLDLIGNKLTVVGNKPAEDIQQDVPQKKYIEVFFLPEDVKKNEIHARFEDGLLTISLPKKKIERVLQSIRLT